MGVFIVYTDWGAYEGCGKPEAVFSTKEKAALYIFETDAYWKDNAEIIELEIDPAANTVLPGQNPTSEA